VKRFIVACVIAVAGALLIGITTASAYGWTGQTAPDGAWDFSYVSPAVWPSQWCIGLGGHGSDATSFVEIKFYDDGGHQTYVAQDTTANNANVCGQLGPVYPRTIAIHLGGLSTNTWAFAYRSENYATLHK
jgi:hypothetical protein